jgi:hypothetical protein
MGDHVTSLATVSAILAAVHERTRTGVGRLVETSLLRAGVYAIGSDMAIQLRFGKLASTRGRRETVQPLANFYKTADGRWICLLPRQGSVDWPRIAAAAGRPELVDDPRFASAKSPPRARSGPGRHPGRGLRGDEPMTGRRSPGRWRHHLGALPDAARAGRGRAGRSRRLLRRYARRRGRDFQGARQRRLASQVRKTVHAAPRRSWARTLCRCFVS